MWECVAYNGDEGDSPNRTPNAQIIAQNGATRNTGRAVAQAALPTLT